MFQKKVHRTYFVFAMILLCSAFSYSGDQQRAELKFVLPQEFPKLNGEVHLNISPNGLTALAGFAASVMACALLYDGFKKSDRPIPGNDPSLEQSHGYTQIKRGFAILCAGMIAIWHQQLFKLCHHYIVGSGQNAAHHQIHS